MRPGTRLVSVEVLNWGTFDARVWRLDLNGDNALLTGDIGSGKSTFVDAITTLLVPSQRIDYNKAAGAEKRERDLRSYVLGYYKSERAEEGLSAKPVALRDHSRYSVILGRFRNEGYGEEMTLAQVFYFREREGQPSRFYVVASAPAVHRSALLVQQGHRRAEEALPQDAGRADVRQLSALCRGFPQAARHRQRAGARSFPSDGVHEVGRRPHRFRPRAYAGAVRHRKAHRRYDRAFRRSDARA